MVGIHRSTPIPDSITLQEMGSDVIPSATGEVLGAAFGEGMALNLTPRLFRSQARAASETGVFMGGDPFGVPFATEPEPLLDPETANSQYGIKGVLSFDKPVTQTVAKDLNEHKRAQLLREDTIARRETGLLTGGAARFTANLAAGLIDPINVGTALIPIVGEARIASMLGRGAISTMGVGERAGMRAISGGISGAVGMAALQPLEFALSRQEQEDYTAGDALRAIAIGGLLGGGLHAVGGAVADRVTGRYANPLTQRLEDAGPETRETLLRGALAQAVEDGSVNVAPALDVFEAARAERPPRRVEVMQPEDLLARAERRPDDIIDFLRKEGGVKDEGGELRAMDLHRPVPGKFGILSRKNGLELDYAREVAEEAGFLPPGSTINDLLNALRDTQQGRPVYRPEEAAVWGERQRARQAAARGEARPEEVDPFHPENLFQEEGGIALPDETPRDFTAAARDLAAVNRQASQVSEAARATQAAMQRGSTPELQAVEQEIAEIETRLMPGRRAAEPDAEPAAAPERPTELVEADADIQLANSKAAAFERAANCIIRGG